MGVVGRGVGGGCVQIITFRASHGRVDTATYFGLWVTTSYVRDLWTVLIFLIRQLICRLSPFIWLLVLHTGSKQFLQGHASSDFMTLSVKTLRTIRIPTG